MDNIFGLSMTWILIVLVGIMGLCLLTVAAVAIFRPIVFKMALRNPPRRKTQTALIVVGLMLATLIISAALTTGDTLDHTIKKISYESLNRVDISVGFVGDAGGTGSLAVSNEPIPADLADELSQQFAGDPDFESFMPVLTVDVSAVNAEQQLSEPAAILTGLEWDKVEQIGGIQRPGGAAINLSSVPPGSAIISETLAEDTGTQAGDTLTIFVDNQPVEGKYHPLYLHGVAIQPALVYDWFLVQHEDRATFFRIHGHHAIYETERKGWSTVKRQLVTETPEGMKQRILAWLRLEGEPQSATLD